MSLYRKYRPQSFADVIGQDHVITTLENAVKHDKLAHAYLFAGGRGTGKTSTARILAKVLMTQGLEDKAIVSQIEKSVEDGSIVDLMEIDAASNRGIDDIRDLIEKIQFSPVAAAAKVYIIDEVHMLTKEAFNALLKTLEEPPEYAYFILATTELNKIPATIQSRCQCFPFRQINDEDIIRRLQYIVDNEKITIDREALRAIAAHVDGGMRDAISLLDQLRSLDKITLEEVDNRIGSTGQQYVDKVLEAIDANDSKAMIETVAAIEEVGAPLDIFIRQLLGTLRTKLHEAVASGQSSSELTNMIQTLLQAIRDVRIAPVPGLVLETALMSLCTEDGSKPALKITPKTTPAVKEETKEAPVKAPEETATEPEKTEPEKQGPTSEPEKPASTFEASELSEENLRSQWAEIVKQTEPASARMSLKNGRVMKVDGSTVHIGFSSSFHREKVADTEASRNIEAVLEKMYSQPVKIHCELDGEGTIEATPDDDMVNIADAASEIF